jgi:hypothetical protein
LNSLRKGERREETEDQAADYGAHRLVSLLVAFLTPV